MRVLLLSQYYDPEPVEKVHDLARGLANVGHEVHVLTGFPCYPAGRLYPGYSQSLRYEETMDGIPVTRVPQFPDHSRSVIRRMLYYLCFAVTSFVFGRGIAFKPDVILVYQAALPVGLSGWALSKRWRVPYVLDVVDLWPESVTASGMLKSRFAERVIRRVAGFIYSRAAAINAVTSGFKRNLVAHGVDETKVDVIENWMPEATYRLAAPADPDDGGDRPFTLMYAGNMGSFQHIRTIVDAASLIKGRNDIRFVLVGDGTEYSELLDRASTLRLTNVKFLGRKNPREMPGLYASADVLIAHLKPDVLTRLSIPSKVFAYLAAGRPVIMAVSGEASEFVQRERFGVAVPPCDPAALADAVVQLRNEDPRVLRQMGERARDAYETKYRGGVQIQRMARWIETVARP